MNHFILEIRSLIKELYADFINVPRSQNSLAEKFAKCSVGWDSRFDGDILPNWSCNFFCVLIIFCLGLFMLAFGFFVCSFFFLSILIYSLLFINIYIFV